MPTDERGVPMPPGLGVDVEQRCCQCGECLDLKVYTVNDLRDGFIVQHTYCSLECLQVDGAAIGGRQGGLTLR